MAWLQLLAPGSSALFANQPPPHVCVQVLTVLFMLTAMGVDIKELIQSGAY